MLFLLITDSDIPIESRVKRESSPESAPEYTALVPDIDIPDSFPALEDLAVEEILNGFIPLQGTPPRIKYPFWDFFD